jgi:integrase
VRVRLELEAGCLAGPLNHLGEARGRERRAALAVHIPAAPRWRVGPKDGIRSVEIAQLRGADIVENAFKISPEAGTVKNRKPRTVPLHEHLIEQGFLDFVKANGAGPLFYVESKQAVASNPTNPRKLQYTRAREQVAAWVRSLGVNDPELAPNHAWRHTFKSTNPNSEQGRIAR